MKEKLETLLKEGTARIEATQSEAELQEVKGALLGKQGRLPSISGKERLDPGVECAAALCDYLLK